MAMPSRESANQQVLDRMRSAEPVLVDVAPAIEVVPGFTKNTILTSGPRLPWAEYTGGQRAALIGAARFEKLAASAEEAEARFAAGEILIRGCQELNCVGSLAGVYSASMAVFVVRERASGLEAYCNFYEGSNPKRLNYGVYDQEVHDRLVTINEQIAPILRRVVRDSGEIALKPLMVRALHMGDELHSRNTAAALLFMRELVPAMLSAAASARDESMRLVEALTEDHYFFLRLSMAAAKVTAMAGENVPGSSVVSAMAFNCRNFAVRLACAPDRWFVGPAAKVDAVFFPGHGPDELAWMGGESPIIETIGLGAFSQAAAFPLLRYQGGAAKVMVERNEAMYRITVGEHADYRIPYFEYRGSPVGIDAFKVLETGILPLMNIGIAGRNGGQIGAGSVMAPMECFTAAVDFHRRQYGTNAD